MMDWTAILDHNAAAPWTFLEGSFWAFLLVVLAVDAVMHRERNRTMRHVWLLAASLLFYWKTSGWFFLILLFSTVSDYLIGHRIAAGKRQATKDRWLALSIFLNLTVLFYFKYTYFLTESWNSVTGSSIIPRHWLVMGANEVFNTGWSVDRILLPVGISFYTFQTISYTVDIRRGLVAPLKRLTDFGFYVSFFPQLVAGPIVRAADFVPQILKPRAVTRATIGLAGFWILNGLLKKVLLADWIAVNFNDRVFADPGAHSSFEVLMALYGYSLQVYADFSGYTDMAIGVALLMGYTLPQNFNSPYKADSCGDFWKRWHMSLSGWLKDYLYIPMGGNRRASWFTAISGAFLLSFVALLWPEPRVLGAIGGVLLAFAVAMSRIPAFKRWVTTNVNIWMTMLLGGLWHGAGWNFVIWGGLNGLGITVYKLWRKISPWESKDTFWKKAVAVGLTFHFITFTRIWFRSASHTTWAKFGTEHNMASEWDTAMVILSTLATGTSWDVTSGVLSHYALVFAVMLLGYAIHLLPSSWKGRYRQAFVGAPLALQAACAIVAVTLASAVLSAGGTPFIYFQF
jgi:D-alanyl-lipoteichoic acid acyltransferase DltB (MBOAT superfamily)